MANGRNPKANDQREGLRKVTREEAGEFVKQLDDMLVGAAQGLADYAVLSQAAKDATFQLALGLNGDKVKFSFGVPVAAIDLGETAAVQIGNELLRLAGQIKRARDLEALKLRKANPGGAA